MVKDKWHFSEKTAGAWLDAPGGHGFDNNTLRSEIAFSLNVRQKKMGKGWLTAPYIMHKLLSEKRYARAMALLSVCEKDNLVLPRKASRTIDGTHYEFEKGLQWVIDLFEVAVKEHHNLPLVLVANTLKLVDYEHDYMSRALVLAAQNDLFVGSYDVAMDFIMCVPKSQLTAALACDLVALDTLLPTRMIENKGEELDLSAMTGKKYYDHKRDIVLLFLLEFPMYSEVLLSMVRNAIGNAADDRYVQRERLGFYTKLLTERRIATEPPKKKNRVH